MFLTQYSKHIQVMFGRVRITKMLDASDLTSCIQELAHVMQFPLGVLLFGKQAILQLPHLRTRLSLT